MSALSVSILSPTGFCITNPVTNEGTSEEREKDPSLHTHTHTYSIYACSSTFLLTQVQIYVCLPCNFFFLLLFWACHILVHFHGDMPSSGCLFSSSDRLLVVGGGGGVAAFCSHSARTHSFSHDPESVRIITQRFSDNDEEKKNESTIFPPRIPRHCMTVIILGLSFHCEAEAQCFMKRVAKEWRWGEQRFNTNPCPTKETGTVSPLNRSLN